MRLWTAITYHLFAGAGNPRRSIRMRAIGFLAGLGIAGGLAYRFTPHLDVSYEPARIAALVCMLSVCGVFAIGMITESQQRLFISKLSILRLLPLSNAQVRKAYLYASLPVGSITAVVVSVALFSAFKDSGNALLIGAYGAACTVAALFADILLRITTINVTLAYVVRVLFAGTSAYLAHMLFLPTTTGNRYLVASVSCAVALSVTMSQLTRRSTRTEYRQLHLPIAESEMTQPAALGVRALRTLRYLGSNVLLCLALAAVVLVARSPAAYIPLDGAVMGAFLLIGTLGQESRSLSRSHYPIELVLYGTLRTWLTATWMLALVNGLVCIDICLAAVRFWAPHGLSVSLLYAGCTGLVFVSLGIVAGSLVAPQKRDIFAQCVSTAVYGVLVWAVIKLLATSIVTRLHPLLWVSVLTGACLLCSYICERLRWHKDIRRKHVRI